LSKYKAFDESGLLALANLLKQAKNAAAENSAAVDGLGEDIQGMSGQITDILQEIDECLETLDNVKADTEAVEQALGGKQDKLTFDSAPTSGSTNPVTSGGVFTALSGKSATGHNHTKSEITDFSHTHTKSNITDFAHSHTKSEISDFAHTHNKSEISDFPTSLKNPSALTFGSKTYDGSSAQEITAADLGLSSAMLYLGKTTTEISDGSTTNPVTVNSKSVTATSGNVVAYGAKEFIWNGTDWEEFGNEGSYKVVQSAVASPSASGSATAFIDTISQDAQGKITVTKKNVSFPAETDPTVPAWAKAATKPSYTASEVGARPSTWTPSASDVGAVPTSRKVNGKALTGDISLTASDVGAAASSHGTHVPTPQTANNAKFLRNDNSWQTVTPANIGAAASSHTHDDRYYTESEVDTKLSGKANSSHGNHVPATQTANNAVFLRNDNTWQTVTPANIGAAASSHSHSNYVPTSRTVNGKALSANISLTYSDVGAAASSHTHSYAASSHTHDDRYYTESEVNNLLNGKANSSHSHSYLPLSGGTVTGATTFTGGAKISGRYAGGGDDEGLVIGRASNSYAGVCLGDPTGVRSVFYLLPDNSAQWRYYNGSASYDIKHPGKAGTIALTSDIPTNYLPLSGGTMTGSLNFANSTWNLLGDDVYFGDRDVAGGFCIEGKNGNTNIYFMPYSGSAAGAIAWTGSQFTISGGNTVVSTQTPGSSCLRNTKLVSADTNPSVNGEINWTYK